MADQSGEVVAQVATQLVKDSLLSLYDPISKYLTVQKAQFLEGFNSYSELTHRKNSLIRTLYSKNRPIPLSEVYVDTNFILEENEYYSDTDLISKFAKKKRIVVKGNGGSGKTIFLKHLWVSRFEKHEGRIPIFVELRRLNDLSSVDILAFCRNELQSDMSFGKDVFEKLCENGKFEFILDGFDEVNRENRKIVEQQIISLSEKYRDCCFLVSGREDDRFSAWGEFEIYSVLPLKLEDVKDLIRKIPFDPSVKKKFTNTLNTSFYKQHQSFLSSPLLAVMMLMTFNENATIPSKLTEFYKSAFQTLLTWHDATKDSFERERALSVDEFRKVFSTFCLITYYDQAFEFDEETFRRYIKKALDYHSIGADLDDVKNDICESANLLQKDGLKYIFVHRSFQEYFAAECTMQVVSGKAKDFLEAFSIRTRDTVFAMCYEIHPELVYDQYFSDCINTILQSDYLETVASKRVSNSWMCESAWMDLFSLSHQEPRVSTLSIQTNPDQKYFLRNISLCEQVADANLGDTPTEILLETLYDSAHVASKNTFKGTNARRIVRVFVTFNGDIPKISIRNQGEHKYSQKEINLFRKNFKVIFLNDLSKSKKSINNFYRNAHELLLDMQKKRISKEKSIDVRCP